MLTLIYDLQEGMLRWQWLLVCTFQDARELFLLNQIDQKLNYVEFQWIWFKIGCTAD